MLFGVSPRCLLSMPSDQEIRICVPLNERSLTALELSSAKAITNADLIELRVDGLAPAEIDQAGKNIAELIAKIPRPVILTYRSTQEGGYSSVSDQQRREFWNAHRHTSAAFFDIEYDLASHFSNLEVESQPDWSRVICSHHNFSTTPDNITALYEQLAFTSARILKLAVTANDIVDCLAVFSLLARANAEQRELIAIAMGDAGVITRILGPSRGSFLTYGASDTDRGTAPGQLLASTLKNIYRIGDITTDTMITGLVGKPVMHSVSPHLHNAAFAAANLNAVYLPLEVSSLASFFTRMVNPRTREFDWNLRGLSITAPHKTEVMNYLDWIDPLAVEIGAVNTVVIDGEQLHGYNTDIDGFIEPLLKRCASLAGARVAFIGAGGAAKAAIYALQRQGADVTLFARNLDKAGGLAERFKISCSPLEAGKFSNFDVVINTTPSGSHGELENDTVAKSDQLQGSRLAYDLVYNPLETRFMREARDAGCEVLGGLEMLVVQAQHQFKFWTNENASYELMYDSAFSELARNSSPRS